MDQLEQDFFSSVPRTDPAEAEMHQGKPDVVGDHPLQQGTVCRCQQVRCHSAFMSISYENYRGLFIFGCLLMGNQIDN